MEPATILFTFCCLLGEVLREETTRYYRLPIRIVIGTWLLSCLIFTSSYSGNLKSQMAKPKFNQPVRNLEDLMGSSYTWSWVDYSSSYQKMWAFHPSPWVRKGWLGSVDGKLLGKSYTLLTKYVHRVYEKRDICVLDAKAGLNTIIAYSYTDPSGRQLMKKARIEELISQYAAVGYPKVSPIRSKAEVYNARAIEMGLYEHWERLTLQNDVEKIFGTNSDPVTYKEESLIAPYTIDDMQAMFYLLLVMLGVSLITFLVEYQWHKWQTAKHHQNLLPSKIHPGASKVTNKT